VNSSLTFQLTECRDGPRVVEDAKTNIKQQNGALFLICDARTGAWLFARQNSSDVYCRKSLDESCH